MTDLLKLKLRHTGNVVGKYHSYEVMGVDSLPEIEAVLVSTVNCYPDELEILIMSEPTDAPKTCVAKFTDMGQNKINCIKAVREHTQLGD
uniref:Uncharacterized protein n=1 Tax=viral metagenome TaxID=1070528 RepID=A0A6M3LYD2_9ZZZZ